MVLNCWYIFVVLLIVCLRCTAADDIGDILHRLDATENLVKALSNRVDLLEAREKIHLQRIAELESNDHQQEETIGELLHQLEKNRQLDDPVNDAQPTIEREDILNEQNGVRKEVIKLAERTLDNGKGNAVQRIRQANVESVAFLATLTHRFTHVGVHQSIEFDQVVTNIGGSYNPATGIFTAPVEGIYVFSATLTADASTNHTDAHASFYHNNNKINVVYVSMQTSIMTSSTITLHMQQGDIVTVRNDDADDAYYGPLHSSFTGFLLFSY